MPYLSFRLLFPTLLPLMLGMLFFFSSPMGGGHLSTMLAVVTGMAGTMWLHAAYGFRMRARNSLEDVMSAVFFSTGLMGAALLGVPVSGELSRSLFWFLSAMRLCEALAAFLLVMLSVAIYRHLRSQVIA